MSYDDIFGTKPSSEIILCQNKTAECIESG